MPGEEIVWKFVLIGDTAVSATYRITDPDGYVLAQGSVDNDTFSYLLPTEHAVNLKAYVYVTGSSSTYIATSTAQVFRGYFLEFRVLDSSYAPGDIMKINYTISKVGDVPDNIGGYQLTVSLVGEYTFTVWVDEMFGVLEYQIPENITDGRHLVQVLLVNGGGFTDVQSVIIDSDAGELAHGTMMGMNTGAFIALLIAIIGLVLAIIGLMRTRGGKGEAKPKKAKKPKKSKEAAPAPAPPQEPQPQEQPYYQPQPEQPVEPVEPEQGYYPPPPPTEPAPGSYPPPPTE
jgi:hypothetical protein